MFSLLVKCVKYFCNLYVWVRERGQIAKGKGCVLLVIIRDTIAIPLLDFPGAIYY